MRELDALTHRLEVLAFRAACLVDDLDPAAAPRGPLRDLLRREFAVNVTTADARLRLDEIVDDVIELLAAPYVDAAREIAVGLSLDDPDAFNCLDCGADTIELREYYMLEKPVWLEANPADDGMLCIGCVEERLGRRLTPADFLDIDMNRSPDQSPRLRSRVLGVEAAPAA